MVRWYGQLIFKGEFQFSISVPVGLICSVQRCLVFLRDSVIKELRPTGLNAFGRLGRYRISFLMLCTWILSGLLRAVGFDVVYNRANWRVKEAIRESKGGRTKWGIWVMGDVGFYSMMK